MRSCVRRQARTCTTDNEKSSVPSERYRDGMADERDTDADAGVEPDDGALEAYDLDGDGEISALEGLRAELGIVDARLEETAEAGGVKGRIAEVAHRIVDPFDND